MTDTNGASLPFRMVQTERDIARLEEWRGTVDTQRATQAQQMRELTKAMDNLAVEVESLRGRLLTLTLSIAGSCVVFALSVLIATGKVGG